VKEAKRFYGTGTTVAAFVLLFAALASLLTGIVLSARRTSAVLFEHELERAANGLVEDFVRNNRLEYEYFGERIVGFGILRWDGETVVSYGEGLETGEVPPATNRGPVYVYDKKKAVATLYRPIGMPMAMSRGRRMQPPAPPLDLGRLLYLRFEAGDYFRRQDLYTAAAVAGPVLVAILTGAFFYLYSRNLQYRREIEDREKLAQLGESARTLMHEIKNPLNAINIRASILEKTGTDEVTEDARAIREEVARLKNLAERINTFLKDPVGEQQRIEVVPYIRDLLKANRWEGIGISVETPEGEAAQVEFDRERFRSVIENIVSNAHESGEGAEEGAGTVEIYVQPRKRALVVRVADRGVGLPETDVERLFDPFFTTKTRGSGIGLAVSRRYMRAAGGDVEVRPRDGGGAEVLLTFPRVLP